MSLLLALSGQSDRARVCPLLDQSGQRLILTENGLSAYDPVLTWARIFVAVAKPVPALTEVAI
jgi:hypothetical protein